MTLHLAKHGARHLLLASRSGEAAKDAGELKASLEDLGATVKIAACDVSDRQQLQAVSEIPTAHPLVAVIHAAGVLEDGVIESLDAGRLGRVMAPKVDAAIHLHELTKDLPLAEFILFSSAAATLEVLARATTRPPTPLLDAMAQQRRAAGLPGRPSAWCWQAATGMTEHLGESGRARLARTGTVPLSDELGFELFDTARRANRPLLLPMPLDMATLRAHARAGTLPAHLKLPGRRVPGRPASAAEPSLARRLEGAPESEWDAIVLDLVRSHTAAVLGHASAAAIDPQRAFNETGLELLGAVESNNQLSHATGMKLPATDFDYPAPSALAVHLRSQLAIDTTARPVVDEELRLEAILTPIATHDSARERINARLRSLMVREVRG